MSLCASVYMCFVVTCWERADLLALVCGVFCEFVTFPLVSWVRCGTWLYLFLIFAPLLTLLVVQFLFRIQQLMVCLRTLIKHFYIILSDACIEPMTTPTNEPVAYVIDSNASISFLSPIPDNFQDLAEMISDRLLNPSAKSIQSPNCCKENLLSAVCDCGISWLYSLTIFVNKIIPLFPFSE